MMYKNIQVEYFIRNGMLEKDDIKTWSCKNEKESRMSQESNIKKTCVIQAKQITFILTYNMLLTMISSSDQRMWKQKIKENGMYVYLKINFQCKLF